MDNREKRWENILHSIVHFYHTVQLYSLLTSIIQKKSNPTVYNSEHQFSFKKKIVASNFYLISKFFEFTKFFCVNKYFSSMNLALFRIE